MATLFYFILAIVCIQTSAVWPRGQYCLPMPSNERCPLGWEKGYRFHTTEGNNTIRGGVPYVATRGRDLGWGFCCKTGVRYSHVLSSWPRGSYCIFRKGGVCPRGFMEGTIHWDDKDKWNTNSAEGTLPDGVYEHNTQIYFCCRDDGPRTLTRMPQCNNLMLMKYNTCPVVDGYLGPFGGSIDWNTEDLSNNDQGAQAYPDGFSQHRSGIKLQFCSYTSSYSC